MSKYSIYLGDNPFFGVNHLSQDIARAKAESAQSFENILNVMKYSNNKGVNKMIISPHPVVPSLMTYLEKKSDLLKRFEFNPILPYAQGYVSKVNESGMMNTLQEILKSVSIRNRIKILAKGGLATMQNDFFKLFEVLIDIELAKIKGARINTIFLHDAIADLGLGLNMKQLFQTFSNYVKDSYGINVGIVTKNFPRLVSKLSEWDINPPYIMTSFNPIGFQMNPSRELCESALKDCKSKVIAMSILAGGYMPLDEASNYLSSLPKIEDLVVGVSSIEHAQETFEKFLKD